jgi:beta-phosphoglucomutase
MHKKSLKIKAIIFDMDGVITNTMPDHYRAWKEIFKGEGVHVTRHDIYKREGQRGIHSVREITRDYKIPFQPDRARTILAKKEKLFKSIVKTRYIPGSRRFIKQLKSGGFILALVTGTSRHELHRILFKRHRDLFQVIITGSDVIHGKPHPEPFVKALRLLNISAGEALVIENAPFGIRSAKEAGIRCFALETSLSRDFLKEADEVYSSYNDMLRKVKLINSELLKRRTDHEIQ